MSKQQDLPLKTDIGARFVPKIVSLMVYLGTLCFVFTLFMWHSARTWEAQLDTQLTVEIPTSLGVSSAILQSEALQVLQNRPDIASISVVSHDEMASLLESFVGKDAKLDFVSMPIIIDVSVKDRNNIDFAGLESQLKALSPLIQVTDHRSWESQVMRLANSSVVIAFLITLLVLLAALATTTFAAKTSLLIHRQVIEVLSLIGATNEYIAKQFQTNALKQGLLASGIGAGAALLTFLLIGFLFQTSELSFLFSSSFLFEAIAVFLLAPPLTALLMMVSTRFTVLKTLSE